MPDGTSRMPPSQQCAPAGHTDSERGGTSMVGVERGASLASERGGAPMADVERCASVADAECGKPVPTASAEGHDVVPDAWGGVVQVTEGYQGIDWGRL